VISPCLVTILWTDITEPLREADNVYPEPSFAMEPSVEVVPLSQPVGSYSSCPENECLPPQAS